MYLIGLKRVYRPLFTHRWYLPVIILTCTPFWAKISSFLCLWTHNLQVNSLKRIGCHRDLYTISRCCTRSDSEDHYRRKPASKGSTLALKPRTSVTRSPKQGYQWPHKKDLYPSPNIKKNFKKYNMLGFRYITSWVTFTSPTEDGAALV